MTEQNDEQQNEQQSEEPTTGANSAQSRFGDDATTPKDDDSNDNPDSLAESLTINDDDVSPGTEPYPETKNGRQDDDDNDDESDHGRS